VAAAASSDAGAAGAAVADAAAVAAAAGADAGAAAPTPAPEPAPKGKDPRGKVAAKPHKAKEPRAKEPKAKVAAAAAAEPSANSFEGLMKAAEEHFKRAETSQAIAKYEAARALRPGNAGVYKILGKLYMRTRQTDRGVRAYKQYLELNPSASDAEFIRGIIGGR
jgi:tetratricopeptide (TPR) repeat protein